jgi:2,4-diaminopentanoate dehydrogenase
LIVISKVIELLSNSRYRPSVTPPRPPYRVIQWGTGAVGAEMITAILDHRTDLDLVGVKVYSGAKHGKDVGTLVGRDPVGVLATADIAEVLAMPADCVLPLALSGMSRTIDKITLQERADWSMYESTGITFDNMAFGQPVEQINTTTNDFLAFSWLFTEQVRYRRCAMRARLRHVGVVAPGSQPHRIRPHLTDG